MESNTYRIHGLGVRVASGDADFNAFTSRYLAGFESDPSGGADLEVVVDFASGFSFRPPVGAAGPGETLGMRERWDGRTRMLSVRAGDISYQLSLGQPANILASFRPNFFKDLSNRLFFAGSGTAQSYRRAVCRTCVQNPAFLMLAEKSGLGCLSGAAVRVGHQALVIAGLPGSGKSNLIARLKERLGAEILAENFALVSGDTLYPFPEGAGSAIAPLPVSHVLVLSHGPAFSARALGPEQGLLALEAINAATGELPEHSGLASLALVGHQEWLGRSRSAIEQLAARVPVHRLVADPGSHAAVTYIAETYAGR